MWVQREFFFGCLYTQNGKLIVGNVGMGGGKSRGFYIKVTRQNLTLVSGFVVRRDRMELKSHAGEASLRRKREFHLKMARKPILQHFFGVW